MRDTELYRHLLSVGVALLLALGFASLVQANPGDLDPSFGTGGQVTTDFGAGYDSAAALALQADGKIVVAGEAFNGTGGDFALVRYNPDGSLDTTFGTDGMVTTDFGAGYDSAAALALQTDSKVVVAGYAQSHTDYTTDFALARYNTDGTLDTSFGTGGKVTTDLGDFYDSATDLALQADGKVVVAGYSWNGSLHSLAADFALARYKTDGSLDPSFGTGGKVTTDFGADYDDYDVAKALALQADGKIVVAGSSPNDSTYNGFALARYNIDGSLDTTFGTDGKVTTNFRRRGASGANALALQADGKIVVAGFSPDNIYSGFALARYNTDGTLDTTFGRRGKVTTDFSAFYDEANALALQADGKIVVAGGAFNGTDDDFALARYLGDAEAEPVLSVSPRVLNFGKVEVGTTAGKSFTVENTGGGALTGNATTAAPFSIVEGSSFSLGEGQSQEVVVRFSPSLNSPLFLYTRIANSSITV